MITSINYRGEPNQIRENHKTKQKNKKINKKQNNKQ
jgi:hypothetical protein